MSDRLPASVYRRRRLVALGAVVLVIVLVWWAIAALFGGGGSSSAAAPATTATPTASSTPKPPPTTASPTPTPTPTPTTSPPPTATPAAAACTDDGVTVTAVTDAAAYAEGAQPKLSLVVKNAGAEPCVIDVGTATQVYTIAHEATGGGAGSDLTVWVSTHCQQQPTNELVELAPGQELAAPALQWVREYSAPDTCDGARPQAETASEYTLTVAIGGITSVPVSFTLD